MAKAVIFFLLWAIPFLPDVSADTIELKDGRVITAEILRETDDSIVVSKRGQEFVYAISKDEIKNITKTTAEDAQQQKETVKEKIKNLWYKIIGSLKDTSRTVRKEDEAYLLEKYDMDVQAAKEAKERKAAAEGKEKKSSFRDFRRSCRKCPYSK